MLQGTDAFHCPNLDKAVLGAVMVFNSMLTTISFARHSTNVSSTWHTLCPYFMVQGRLYLLSVRMNWIPGHALNCRLVRRNAHTAIEVAACSKCHYNDYDCQDDSDPNLCTTKAAFA